MDQNYGCYIDLCIKQFYFFQSRHVFFFFTKFPLIVAALSLPVSQCSTSASSDVFFCCTASLPSTLPLQCTMHLNALTSGRQLAEKVHVCVFVFLLTDPTNMSADNNGPCVMSQILSDLGLPEGLCVPQNSAFLTAFLCETADWCTVPPQSTLSS